MNPVYFGLFSVSMYLAATGYLIRQIQKRLLINKTLLLGMGLFAFILHAISAYYVISTPEGLYFSFFQVMSLFGWVIAAVALFTSVIRPVTNLTVVAFPSAAFGIVCSLFVKTSAPPLPQVSNGILLHIILSLLAYSVLAIAVAQALLLYLQNYQLKHKHMSSFVQLFPPLQTMESLLFEMIWTGFILLSISIASGLIFLDNMFAQHLVHKSVLSICAWLTFATLLWGRHQLGWRGVTAFRGTLIGFVLLLLAYFGSKLVLEIILHRV